MDHREYDSLRDKVFLTKETFMEASKSDDANLMCELAEDVRRGYFGYVNIGLSSDLARKALNLGPRPFNKRRSYALLIENAMLSGSPYMDIIREALDDGIIPDRPLKPNDSEYGFIRDHSSDVTDFHSIVDRCWSGVHKTDPYWAGKAMDVLKAEVSAGESAVHIAHNLMALSSFDCGEDYRNDLLGMVRETLSRDDADDSFGAVYNDLHDALEKISGKREDELLIRSARKGHPGALQTALLRYPNAEGSLKDEYLDAINESIRNGKLDYGLKIEWYGYGPYDVLPRPSIEVAIEHLNEGKASGNIKKDSKEAFHTYIAIAKSMFAYGDEEAFRYLIECPWLNICPMLYSMLIDGFGTEKDEDTAKEVAKAYDDNDDEKLKAILGKLRGKKQ